MSSDQTHNPSHESTSYGWRVDWWGLLRGLILLFSALLSTTILYYVILTIARG